MVEWSLLSEYLALILIVVVMLFFRDKQQTLTPRRRLFWTSLWLSFAGIVVNILTVVFNEYTAFIPRPLNIAVNTAYFVISITMCSAIIYYLIVRMLEFVQDDRHRKFALVVICAETAVFMLLIIANLFSGCLFYFDDAGNYHRGPLNSAMYLAPASYVVLFLVSYVINRQSVSQASTRIIRVTPILVSFLVVLQVMYPNQLLNGTMAAYVNLVAFLSYQCSRVDRDPLTGAANRLSFLNELPLRTANGTRCQIIAVSLRQFSSINEVHGQRGGDALLFRIAEALRLEAQGGHVYRYNNVEFLLLFPGGTEQENTFRLKRVTDSMCRTWQLGESVVNVPTCIAELSLAGQNWSTEQILSYLDYAMQLAKDEARSVVRFDAETAARYVREEHVLRTMKNALNEGGFTVFYQPVYFRDSKRFQTAEALIRLQAGGEYISPAEFIPIAERTGLIDELSWVVLENTCRMLGDERLTGLDSVSVNLSIGQLTQRGLADRIGELLSKYDVAPSRLKIEITERAMAEDEAAARRAMEELRRRGVGFYLDDFGTGYSNFSSVLSLPFETIKLDRSLVSGLADDPKSRLMVGALVPFFHKLGHNIVAEGIEESTVADIAFDFGVDRIQGFFYARPMPEEKLVKLFSEQESGN